MGVYIYEHRFFRVAQEEALDYFDYLERHLKILQESGVNMIYLGGTSQARFARHLELFDKYGMVVIPQLDFAYYRHTWDEETLVAQAKVAAAFINRHADAPNVLAFSVREEVAHDAINGLARYYAAILAEAPNARFQLIHSSLGAATDAPVPDPTIIGTDRYAFWWEFSGGGYVASPAFSLNWVREQAARFSQQAARRGADFSLVVTQGGMMMPDWANRYGGEGTISYPKTPKEQDEIRQRIRQHAAAGKMGWQEFDTPQGKRFNVWKYYRLPQNTLKALAWTGVLHGAKSFSVWMYSPPTKELAQTTFKSAALVEKPAKEVYWYTLAGRPGMDNPQLKEFAEASREIRAYEKIISRMSLIPGKKILLTKAAGVHQSVFTLPQFNGQIVVLHNANTGTWPANSAYFFKESDDIRIDDEGNLVGYKAFEKPLSIPFYLEKQHTGKPVYDVLTGNKLSSIDEQYTTSIAPGSGTLLFVGPEDEAGKVSSWLKAKDR